MRPFTAIPGFFFLVLLLPSASRSQAVTVFFQDDFNDGIADAWTVTSGNPVAWQVQNNAYFVSLAGQNVGSHAVAGDRAWTDYTFQVDVRGIQGVDKTILFRYTNSANHYAINVRSDWNSRDEVLLSKAVAGNVTTLYTTTYPSQVGQWYQFRVELSGPQITFYLDDAFIFQYIDNLNPHLNGRVAFSGWTGNAGIDEVDFDNVLVTGFADPPISSSCSLPFTLTDFTNTNCLNLVGTAQAADTRLLLSPGVPFVDRFGSVWYDQKQFVDFQFETTFQFQIENPTAGGADGFAFVIHNDNDFAIGSGGGGLGYFDIANSLAIEFDTWENAAHDFRVPAPEPNDNHISVQTRGTDPNSSSPAFSLASTTDIPDLSDGRIHTVKVTYSPGTLSVFFDDFEVPVLVVSVDLATTLSLDSGRAWIGFTAASGSTNSPNGEYHYILSWSFLSFSTPRSPDTDGDGLPDSDEQTIWKTDPLDPDTDDDALPDGWEAASMPGEYGAPLPLYLMGARPRRKDVFVEIDWMRNPPSSPLPPDYLKPEKAALELVIDAFINAPVPNPSVSDPSDLPGILLHIDYGQGCEAGDVYPWRDRGNDIEFDEFLTLEGPDDNFLTGEWWDLIQEVTSPERRGVFHHCVFINAIEGPENEVGGSRTGVGFNAPPNRGGTFCLVALGVYVERGEPIPGGSHWAQAGTFMHELGHTLGLSHGGYDDILQKPNYLSVLNYPYQTTGLRANEQIGHFDYCRFRFPDPSGTLDERDLDERIGIQAPSFFNVYQFSFHTNGSETWATINDPVNWDLDANLQEPTVLADINNDGPDGLPTLASRDDWQTLVYSGILRERGGITSLAKTSHITNASSSLQLCPTTEQISNIPLPIPGNLQAYRAGSSVTFSWTHPWRGGPQNSPIFSHYNVYRSIDGGPLELIGTTTANRFSDSLEASGNASYAVSVVTVAGEEGQVALPQNSSDTPSLVQQWKVYE